MDPASERQPATIPARPARGRHGAVVSPHHLATGAGLAMLRAGGSAVDAAIATNAALAVVAGHSCGLGGDAFWLIWDADQEEALALNGSGRAGSGATPEAVRAAGHAEMPVTGPWSVSVPGAVDSWGRAHARFGRLAWDALFEPAIDLAQGFPAGRGWIEAVERATGTYGVDDDWARVYRSHGRAWGLDEIVRLPALARTLRQLADEGAATAYSGRLARRTARYFGERGVPVTAEDLAAHTSDWLRPIGIDYRGTRSLTHPPNSVGVVALQTLGILGLAEAPSARAFDGRGWSDADWIHRGLEASRLALAERDAHVTDAERMAPGAVEQMLGTERIAQLAGRIDPEQPMPPVPTSLPGDGGTVYLATADRWGGLVSLLESNYQGFGSGLVDPETGIAFHDRAAFFRLEAGHPNVLAPGKRTAHTLAPGMLLRDGRPWVVHGSMGGEIQPQVFAQVVSALVDGGTDVATAVAAPRWAARMSRQHGPPELSELEARIDPGVADDLAARGHRIVMRHAWAPEMGHAHAIEVVRDPDGRASSFVAGADPRAESLAAAF